MPRYEFQLTLTPEEFLAYYRGAAKQVVVRCTTGQTVQFPASLLRNFVSHDGIRGTFVLTSDDHHKNVKLQRST